MIKPPAEIARQQRTVYRQIAGCLQTGIVCVALLVGLTGCMSNDRRATTDQMPAVVPTYDVAPQVIYRIDRNRFISLENYDRCYGDNYYNDTQTGVHTKILRGNSSTTFRGRLIIDDPSGMNVVIPSASQSPCGDRGCKVPLYYSTDGGRTFKGMAYMNSSYPPKDSENYIIAVTSDGIYVSEKRLYGGDSGVRKYPLASGIDLNRPYPPGMHDESFMASKNADLMISFRTPSGQDRFTCDEPIRPTNLSKSQ